MTAYQDRANMASQRERVLLKADEIVDLLTVGVPVPEIKRRVDLHDMPRATFYYHVQKLRDARGISASAHARSGGKGDAVKPPSSTPVKQAEEAVKSASEPDAKTQLNRAPSTRPGEDVPKKIPPKRRKYVSASTGESKTDEQGYDPAKWKKLDV